MGGLGVVGGLGAVVNKSTNHLRLPSDGCPADLRQRCHQLAALRRAAVTSATTPVASAGMGPPVNEDVCCETWSASTSTDCMAAGGVRVTSSSQGLVLEIAAACRKQCDCALYNARHSMTSPSHPPSFAAGAYCPALCNKKSLPAKTEFAPKKLGKREALVDWPAVEAAGGGGWWRAVLVEETGRRVGGDEPEVHAAEPSAKTRNSHCQLKLPHTFNASSSAAHTLQPLGTGLNLPNSHKRWA